MPGGSARRPTGGLPRLGGGLRNAALVVAFVAGGCPKGGGSDPAVVATLQKMEIVHRQIEIWAREHHRAPTAEQGLAAVFDGQVPVDGWGREIRYVVPGPDGWAFDLVSLGSDGQQGGRGPAADLVWSEIRSR